MKMEITSTLRCRRRRTGTAVSLILVNLPEGLSIDPDTGAISGTIAEGAAADSNGTTNATVVADDGFDTSAISFSWFLVSTVNLPNRGNQTTADIRCQSGIAGDKCARTADSRPAFNLPPGLSVDPDTGMISGTVTAGAAANSPYAVTVIAEDDADSWVTSFSWLVTGTAVSASTVDLANPGDETGNAGIPTSTWPCKRRALWANQFSIPRSAATRTGIDPAAGVISGTIATQLGGVYPVTVTANDGTDSSTVSFSWLVTSTVVLYNPGDQTASDGSDVNLALQATTALGSQFRTWQPTCRQACRSSPTPA